MTIHEAARLRAAIRNERENSKALAKENIRLQDESTEHKRLLDDYRWALRNIRNNTERLEEDIVKLKLVIHDQGAEIERCRNRECM